MTGKVSKIMSLSYYKRKYSNREPWSTVVAGSSKAWETSQQPYVQMRLQGIVEECLFRIVIPCSFHHKQWHIGHKKLNLFLFLTFLKLAPKPQIKLRLFTYCRSLWVLLNFNTHYEISKLNTTSCLKKRINKSSTAGDCNTSTSKQSILMACFRNYIWQLQSMTAVQGFSHTDQETGWWPLDNNR